MSEKYPKGSRWRVTGTTKLWGLRPYVPDRPVTFTGGLVGASIDLKQGDIIESLGTSMSWGSDGWPILKWKDPTGSGAFDLTLQTNPEVILEPADERPDYWEAVAQGGA